MSDLASNKRQNLSVQLYSLLLYCYPVSFRRAYMPEMVQAFRDCYRETLRQQSRWGLLRFWQLILRDLATTVVVEHGRVFIAWMRKLLALEERQSQIAMNITFAQQTDVGRERSTNEDSMISVLPDDLQRFRDKGALFVVADGLGGHSGGELASELAVQTVKEVYYQDDAEDRAEALRRAVLEANARIHQQNLAKSPQPSAEWIMGTTCVAAALLDDMVYVANVGDSRAYIVRGDEMKQITRDHSVVADELRAGLITKEQVKDHPRRNVIYRCLGEETVEVDIFTEKVQEGDKLLLCTDGLCALVDDDELRATVQRYSLQESVQRLIDRANELGGSDNITAVVAQVA
jgi:serine/threonine protein phosphatase PrpC